MSRYFKSFSFMAVALLMVSFAYFGTNTGDTGEEENIAVETVDTTIPETTESAMVVLPRPVKQKTLTQSEPAEQNAWRDYPNVCETFTVYQRNRRTKKGTYPVRYRRNRYRRTRSDQKRTRALIAMVSEEMGANPDFVEMIAFHESSWNPEAIHILNPDLLANRTAWRIYSYNSKRERELAERLKITSARSKDFWDIKQRLSRLRLYKPNPFWNALLRYEFVLPERHVRKHGGEIETIPTQRIEEWASVWSYGYGLYGMSAIFYTHLWDRAAPPWILCGDEGIIATVVAVWALRSQQRECANLTRKNPEKYGTDGGNARGVVRRFARGQCSDKRLGKAWRTLMASRSGIDWDASITLGTKWPRWKVEKRRGKLRYTLDENEKKIPTDREELLKHMQTKAAEQGLLRETPLERKHPKSAPVITMAHSASE